MTVQIDTKEREAILDSVSHFVLDHTTVPVLIIHDGDEGLPADAEEG